MAPSIAQFVSLEDICVNCLPNFTFLFHIPHSYSSLYVCISFVLKSLLYILLLSLFPHVSFCVKIYLTELGSQPPIQWVPGALSLGVERQGREADHSPPSSAEIKEFVELYLHSPIRLHGVVLS